jgi:hypothetical protein
MAGESEVTQVQLTEDGSRPVDLPQQFKDVASMATSYAEAQATITRLSQLSDGASDDATSQKAAPKKTDKALPVEVQSALDNIATFNEGQRKLRFEGQIGTEGLAALEGFLSGEAISPALKASYDAAIESGNEALIDANFTMIRQTFEAKNGAFDAPLSMVAGAASGVMVPQGTNPFRSLAEQLAAQKDPRYKEDPAFRMDVENRIAISGTYQV